MKTTEVDSMNRLRVRAERKAALYRRALELACNGDADQAAHFVSEADADQDDVSGVQPCVVNQFSSRMCECGTKGCTVVHGVKEVPQS